MYTEGKKEADWASLTGEQDDIKARYVLASIVGLDPPNSRDKTSTLIWLTGISQMVVKVGVEIAVGADRHSLLLLACLSCSRGGGGALSDVSSGGVLEGSPLAYGRLIENWGEDRGGWSTGTGTGTVELGEPRGFIP